MIAAHGSFHRNIAMREHLAHVHFSPVSLGTGGEFFDSFQYRGNVGWIEKVVHVKVSESMIVV